MKAFVNTNGCTVARLKSMQVRNFLLRNDPTVDITAEPSEAELIVLFACGLTDLSEKASTKIITRLKEEANASARIIVWGCLAKIDPELLASVYDGPAIGPRDTTFFDGLVEHVQHPYKDGSANSLVESYDRYCGLHYPRSILNDGVLRHLKSAVNKMMLPRRTAEPIFHIRIAEGCAGRCTFCSEKLAWGRVQSRSLEHVLSEFRLGLERGFKRFFLHAEDVGAYGTDIGASPVELLNTIATTFSRHDYKILIDQLTPERLLSQLGEWFDVFATGRVESLGCQVQSGSDRILGQMGRRYRAKEWRDAMLRIAAAFPDIRLETHFMVGFPGETEDDFRATLKLLDYPLFIQACNVYVFSPKQRVRAARFPDQVDDKTKAKRRIRLFRKYMWMYCVNRLARWARLSRRRSNKEEAAPVAAAEY